MAQPYALLAKVLHGQGFKSKRRPNHKNFNLVAKFKATQIGCRQKFDWLTLLFVQNIALARRLFVQKHKPEENVFKVVDLNWSPTEMLNFSTTVIYQLAPIFYKSHSCRPLIIGTLQLLLGTYHFRSLKDNCFQDNHSILSQWPP